MSKAITLENSRLLEKIAEEFKARRGWGSRLFSSCRQRLQEAYSEHVTCGLLLIEAKGIVGHGGFVTWVKAHCEVSQNKVEQYIALAGDSKTNERAHFEAKPERAQLLKLEAISKRVIAQLISCRELRDALGRDIGAVLAGATLCGHLLKQARGIIGAARFETWVKNHCDIPIDEAEALMRLAKSAPPHDDLHDPRVLKSACKRLWGSMGDPDTVQLSSMFMI